MFEHFDSDDKFLIYGSLLNSVRANSGHGFINSDQGHLVYRSGANGKPPNLATLGDHPDHNHLYQMMHELSEALKDHPELGRSNLVLSWQDFCKMAVDSYQAPFTPKR
jgi:hypothetical protein